jgi:hypothetical protein
LASNKLTTNKPEKVKSGRNITFPPWCSSSFLRPTSFSWVLNLLALIRCARTKLVLLLLTFVASRQTMQPAQRLVPTFFADFQTTKIAAAHINKPNAVYFLMMIN